jgi:hypothetical protein
MDLYRLSGSAMSLQLQVSAQVWTLGLKGASARGRAPAPWTTRRLRRINTLQAGAFDISPLRNESIVEGDVALAALPFANRKSRTAPL